MDTNAFRLRLRLRLRLDLGLHAQRHRLYFFYLGLDPLFITSLDRIRDALRSDWTANRTLP